MNNRIKEIKETLDFVKASGEPIASAIILCRQTGYSAAEVSQAISEWEKECSHDQD